MELLDTIVDKKKEIRYYANHSRRPEIGKHVDNKFCMGLRRRLKRREKPKMRLRYRSYKSTITNYITDDPLKEDPKSASLKVFVSHDTRSQPFFLLSSRAYLFPPKPGTQPFALSPQPFGCSLSNGPVSPLSARLTPSLEIPSPTGAARPPFANCEPTVLFTLSWRLSTCSLPVTLVLES